MIAQYNLRHAFFVTHVGVSANTFHRWKKGDTAPSEFDLRTIETAIRKEFEGGGPAITNNPRELDYMLQVARLEGRLDQLTKQVAVLQGNDDVAKAEISKVTHEMGDMKKKLQELESSTRITNRKAS